MRVLKHELKKLTCMQMLWVFVAICLVLNVGIVLGYRYKIVDYSFFSYVEDTASITGNVLGNEFSEKLSSMPDSEDKSRLIYETENPTPIYKDYAAASLAEAYIGVYGISGIGVDLLTAKYERLQSVVDQLDREGAELSLYAADTTAEMHNLLFEVVLRAILTEACLLAALMMLYLCTYERQSRTVSTIYSTKIGRGIFRYKVIAGLMISVLCFAAIACVTLLVYFSVFDYTQLWNSSVSSGFNYISDNIGTKPFMTWLPFTVIEYLWAMLGLGLGLTLVFAMMGACIGFLSRNGYIGTLLFFLLALAMMTAPYLFAETGIWGGYFLFEFSPVCLWYSSPWWLTDMGNVSLIPFHETVGIISNIVLWGILLFLSYQYIKRKDVA